MDPELRKMQTQSLSFHIRGNMAYGPDDATVLGPIDAYLEESWKLRIREGAAKQGQSIVREGRIVLDPADDSVITQLLAAEVVEVVLPSGDVQRLAGISTYYDPETGLVDHYEAGF